MEMKEEALKLADELEGYYWGDGDEELTPSMLIRRLVEELDEKNYRILELTKRYKALTWNDKQGSSIWDSTRRVYENCQCDSCKNKTTPQTKPLSVEVIWELHQEHIDEIPCGHSMKTIGFVEFARAIEERHGIK